VRSSNGVKCHDLNAIELADLDSSRVRNFVVSARLVHFGCNSRGSFVRVLLNTTNILREAKIREQVNIAEEKRTGVETDWGH